jgi:O-antigen ligase
MTALVGHYVKRRIGIGRVQRISASSVRHDVSPKAIPTAVRRFFLLFAFTIPFEPIELISGILSPARISGVLFFVSCLFFCPRKCFSRAPRAMWWFLGFVVVYMFNVMALDAIVDELLLSLTTLTQLIVLLLTSSALLEDKKLAREVLLIFAIATIALAFGVMLELPGFSGGFVTREMEGGVRATPLGYSANDLGAIATLGIVTLIGLGLNIHIRSSWIRLILVASTLPLMVLLIDSGSRSGVVALVMGVSFLLLPLGRANKKRSFAVAIAAAALIGGAFIVVNDPLLSARWTVTIEKGDMAGRQDLFPLAGEMIAERPIFGWGLIESRYELARRNYRPQGDRDSHNLLLYLLVTFGVCGTFPFMTGVWLCLRSAWVGRAGDLGLLPLSLLISVLTTNMANTWLYKKPMWLILALALAAAHHVGPRRQLNEPPRSKLRSIRSNRSNNQTKRHQSTLHRSNSYAVYETR